MHKAVLQAQMDQKKVKCDEAREQFEVEKQQVDSIVQKLIREDRM